MRKGYTDGGPWHGNQVRTGPALIRSYSESLRNVVLPVAHVRVGVEAERGAEWKWTRSDGSGVWKGASQGAGKGETRGRRAGGKSYHDNFSIFIEYEGSQIFHTHGCIG